MCYILIGIAAFAIFVAQVFLLFSLQTALATKAADKSEVTRRRLEQLAKDNSRSSVSRNARAILVNKRDGAYWLSCCHSCAFCWLAQLLLVKSEDGHSLLVFFAVVTLTTVVSHNHRLATV